MKTEIFLIQKVSGSGKTTQGSIKLDSPTQVRNLNPPIMYNTRKLELRISSDDCDTATITLNSFSPFLCNRIKIFTAA
jgi:hypothetical protein